MQMLCYAVLCCGADGVLRGGVGAAAAARTRPPPPGADSTRPSAQHEANTGWGSCARQPLGQAKDACTYHTQPEPHPGATKRGWRRHVCMSCTRLSPSVTRHD